MFSRVCVHIKQRCHSQKTTGTLPGHSGFVSTTCKESTNICHLQGSGFYTGMDERRKEGRKDWLTDWLSIWLTDGLTNWLTDVFRKMEGLSVCLSVCLSDWLTDCMDEVCLEWRTDRWRQNEWLNEWMGVTLYLLPCKIKNTRIKSTCLLPNNCIKMQFPCQNVLTAEWLYKYFKWISAKQCQPVSERYSTHVICFSQEELSFKHGEYTFHHTLDFTDIHIMVYTVWAGFNLTTCINYNCSTFWFFKW